MEPPEDEPCPGSEHRHKQDEEEAVARIEEFKKFLEAKKALCKSHLNHERPDVAFLWTLDSNIKRDTAVIKKLKLINEEQRESLMDDLRSVNLSKFVTEAVAAICDAKLRTSDIQAAIQICSLLHQRYKDFSPSLVQGLTKSFFPGKSAEDLDADRNLKAMKKRSSLKLMLELYFDGVIEDSSVFVGIIKDLTSLEHLKDRDTAHTNLPLLASFARQGRCFIGLPQSGEEASEEFFKDLNITADEKKFFKKAFLAYFEAAAELLSHCGKWSMKMPRYLALKASSVRKMLLRMESCGSLLTICIEGSLRKLAEALDKQPPVIPEDGHTTRLTSGDDLSSPGTGKETSVHEAMWDDEDTRSFYECL